MKYQFNMLFEGISAALGYCEALMQQAVKFNCIYKVTAWSFGVASSLVGSSITSGFRRSVLKSWHNPATTS